MRASRLGHEAKRHPRAGAGKGLYHSAFKATRFVNRHLDDVKEAPTVLGVSLSLAANSSIVRAQAGSSPSRHDETNSVGDAGVESESMGAAHEGDPMLSQDIEKLRLALSEAPFLMRGEMAI